MFRPILAKIGAIIGMRRPVIGAGIQILAGQPLAAGTPVANAVLNAAIAVPPPPATGVIASPAVGGLVAGAAVTAVMDSIANNNDVTLTAIKPMSLSVEGWAAVIGGGITAVDSLGPLLGLTPGPEITQAAEQIFTGFGAKPGVGTAVVYLGMGAIYGFLWIRKKFFTHTISPAAADRAIANGKAI